VIKVDRRLAHFQGARYARRKGNRASAGCILGRGLRGDRDRYGTGAQGPGSAGILGSLASMAHGHQLCGELSVHRHYRDQSPLPYAVRRYSNAGVDMDKLRPSLSRVAPAVCDGMDCAHTAGIVSCSLYAGLFVCIDIAYNVFEREVLARADAALVSERTRHMARRRSLVVLAMFTTAMLVAFVAPRLGFGLICGALILHLRPEAPGRRT